MAQPYPGYSCEQVTIVASRILDTIVAFGQTRHNMKVTGHIAHLGEEKCKLKYPVRNFLVKCRRQ
jgi:hypothetical protein